MKNKVVRAIVVKTALALVAVFALMVIVGLIVPVGNAKKLADAMSAMIDSIDKYDSSKIRAKADKYSFDKVGSRLVDIYKSVINR